MCMMGTQGRAAEVEEEERPELEAEEAPAMPNRRQASGRPMRAAAMRATRKGFRSQGSGMLNHSLHLQGPQGKESCDHLSAGSEQEDAEEEEDALRRRESRPPASARRSIGVSITSPPLFKAAPACRPRSSGADLAAETPRTGCRTMPKPWDFVPSSSEVKIGALRLAQRQCCDLKACMPVQLHDQAAGADGATEARLSLKLDPDATPCADAVDRKGFQVKSLPHRRHSLTSVLLPPPTGAHCSITCSGARLMNSFLFLLPRLPPGPDG